MVGRITGALVRAILMVILVATPALMLPGIAPEDAQIVTLIGIFAGALIFSEYASNYPGLIAFRGAPPFNRIRWLAAFAMLFGLGALTRGTGEDAALTMVLAAVGALVGHVIDLPYSPARLLVMLLPPEGATPRDVAVLRAGAGLAALVGLVTLAVFGAWMRATTWPARDGAFNVWTNLPTFDPTVGGDVVGRLVWGARVNLALGILAPFVIPALARSGGGLIGPVSLDTPQTLIWMVTAWAMVPTSFVMRAMAMARVSRMIADKRRRASGGAGPGAFQPV